VLKTAYTVHKRVMNTSRHEPRNWIWIILHCEERQVPYSCLSQALYFMLQVLSLSVHY